MLTFGRRRGQSVIINGNIQVRVTRIEKGQVHLSFRAPPDVTIDRQEVHDAKERKEIADANRTPAA